MNKEIWINIKYDRIIGIKHNQAVSFINKLDLSFKKQCTMRKKQEMNNDNNNNKR